MSREVRMYLADILEFIRRVEVYISGADETAFGANTMMQDSVVRNLELIGEAVKHVPDDMRILHPEVPWRDIVGLRDRVIHEYHGVDMAIVWDVVTSELAPLRSAVEDLVDRLPLAWTGAHGGSPAARA